ncbi:hypothetical protein DM01DRAFT_1336063 [Hesseltinella vesiculosa]|uniref:Uncharacterized protein n=1 Tax=Hesseltinella vesiculosa TaxID=101127 RepID=A0A1X2GGY3_9FUNG|nr:hypothetical protein DM01DRAFT_1336063 [Hesseltinella vesiculosa]
MRLTFLLCSDRLDILPMLLSCLTHLPPGQELFQSLLQFSNRYIKQDASSFLLLVLRAWHRSNAQALAATLAGTVELLIKCIQKTESSAEIIGAQLTDVLVAWWVKDDSGLGVYLDNAPLMTVMTQLAALVDKTWPEDWQAKPNPPFTKRRVKKVMIPQSDEESE